MFRVTAFIGVVVFLALKFFFPAETSWESIQRVLSAEQQREAISVPDTKVWANKQSGFYYCSDSAFYGKLRPGHYMAQGDALQTGYRPNSKEYCRQPKD